MRGWIFLASLALASSAANSRPPSPPTPLFAGDAPIHVTIQGPMGSLASNRAEVPRPATMTVDGRTYKEVGVHFRGASSFMMVPAGLKRSLNISTDFAVKEQSLGGYRTFKD